MSPQNAVVSQVELDLDIRRAVQHFERDMKDRGFYIGKNQIKTRGDACSLCVGCSEFSEDEYGREHYGVGNPVVVVSFLLKSLIATEDPFFGIDASEKKDSRLKKGVRIYVPLFLARGVTSLEFLEKGMGLIRKINEWAKDRGRLEDHPYIFSDKINEERFEGKSYLLNPRAIDK